MFDPIQYGFGPELRLLIISFVRSIRRCWFQFLVSLDCFSGRLIWDRNSEQVFSTSSQAFFPPGVINNVSCPLNEILLNFREESSGIGRARCW